MYIILLTKTTAAQNEVALSYHKVRGIYFLAVFFAATIYILGVRETGHFNIKTVTPETNLFAELIVFCFETQYFITAHLSKSSTFSINLPSNPTL